MTINKNLFVIMGDINDDCDTNSGFSFNITIFIIDENTLKLEDIHIIASKPCIYGLECYIEEHKKHNLELFSKSKFLTKNTDGIFGYCKLKDENEVLFSKKCTNEIKLKLYDILIEDKIAYVEDKKNWWFWTST